MTLNQNGITEDVVQPSVWRMVVLGIVVITPAITPGMASGFSAIALPQLNMTLDEQSWFTSILSVTTPIGNLFTGMIIDRYGRRTSLLGSIIPSIIGWFLMSTPNPTLWQLYGGRLLTGFSLGAISLPATVYAAESITINNLSLRGSLGSWTTLALVSGIMISYILGTFMHFTMVAFVAGCLSILSLALIVLLIPESPIWLHRQGRCGDAEVAQRRLRISQPILRNAVLSQMPPSSEGRTEFSLATLATYAKKMRRAEVYKPLLITIGFLFFLQFCGIYSLTSYMVTVMTVRAPLNPYILSIVAGVIEVLGVLSFSFIVPFSGVKNLSILSSLGVAVGMTGIGVSLQLPSALWVDWMRVVSVWFTVLSASLGFIVVPFSILGEMFPMGAKGFASLSLFASSVFNFVVLKMHPLLFAMYGAYVHYGYALVSICGTAFVVLFVPETVGKTLDEIKSNFKYTPELNVDF